jgi:hypothetical protein
MDADRLNSLARTLATIPSRRVVTRALVALTAGSVLAPVIGHARVEAKKKKGRKKKQKGKCEVDGACPRDEICKGGKCRPGCKLEFDRCAAGQICSPATKLCTTSCRDGLNMPVNELCAYGQVCHSGFNNWCGSPCGPGGVPCPAGYRCYEGESTWGRTNTCYQTS